MINHMASSLKAQFHCGDTNVQLFQYIQQNSKEIFHLK